MSVSLDVGGNNPLSLDGARHLLAGVRATNLKLGPEFQQLLKQPLSAVLPAFSSTSVQFDGGEGSWTPLGGTAPTLPVPGPAFQPGNAPLTFTLSGGVCGKIAVVTGGNLLTYTDGFENAVSTSLSLTQQGGATTKAIVVGQGEVFVTLELDFRLSGGLTGSYQQGIYGVTTTDSASSAISVAFYKRCAPSMTLEDGLKQAFEGFVLPLHEKTLEQLQPGDYLHYNLDGNLKLGLGASIGFDKVFYAATATQALPRTNGAVTLAASISPKAQAGVKFSFAYGYSGSFEMLLWRDADEVNLHLYRAKTQTTREGTNLGISLLSESSGSVAVTLEQVGKSIAGALPSGLQTFFTSKILPAAQAAIGGYANEVSGKVAGWLSKVNSEVASLDVAISRRSDRFLLTDCVLDLKNPKVGEAWKLMLGGRFLDAMELPDAGVTMATGSGLEALFSREASLKLNLFGALRASWTETTLNNAELIYAGNNIFHLVTVEGKDALDVVNATKQQMALYFATEADLSNVGGPIAAPKLHCLLRAECSPGFGAALGKLVGLLSSGPAGTALSGALTSAAKQPGGAVTLHMIFGPDSYGQLDASSLQHQRPDDESKDEKNYAAFQSACAAMYRDGPPSLRWNGHALSYNLWRDAWRASNDQWPAAEGSLPNRREHAGFNSYVSSQLGETVPGLEGSQGAAQLVFYALSAATQFMNFCDDLRTLASETAVFTPQTWSRFVNELATMVKNDVNTDFTPATALALATLCGGTPKTVSGPTPDLPAGRAFGVTMTYGAA